MYEVDYDYSDGGFLELSFMIDLVKVIFFEIMSREY